MYVARKYQSPTPPPPPPPLGSVGGRVLTRCVTEIFELWHIFFYIKETSKIMAFHSFLIHKNKSEPECFAALMRALHRHCCSIPPPPSRRLNKGVFFMLQVPVVHYYNGYCTITQTWDEDWEAWSGMRGCG